MITEIREKIMNPLSQANKIYKDAQDLRKQSLLKYKRAGEGLLEARNYLKKATKNNPIEGYYSFDDFLKRDLEENYSVKRAQAYKYIFLAENWEVVVKIKLLSQEGCYRLERSIVILKWAVNKLKEDPNWEGTILDYWSEQENKVKTLEEKINKFERELKKALNFLNEEQKVKFAEMLVNN